MGTKPKISDDLQALADAAAQVQSLMRGVSALLNDETRPVFDEGDFHILQLVELAYGLLDKASQQVAESDAIQRVQALEGGAV